MKKTFPVTDINLFKNLFDKDLKILYGDSQYEYFYYYGWTYHGNFLETNALEGILLIWENNPFDLDEAHDTIYLRKIK